MILIFVSFRKYRYIWKSGIYYSDHIGLLDGNIVPCRMHVSKRNLRVRSWRKLHHWYRWQIQIVSRLLGNRLVSRSGFRMTSTSQLFSKMDVTRHYIRMHPPGSREKRLWQYLSNNQPMYDKVYPFLRNSEEKKSKKIDHVIEKSNFLWSKILKYLIDNFFLIESTFLQL